MSGNTCSTSTEDLVKFFVNYKLRKAGYNDWKEGPLNPVKSTLLVLSENFERAYYAAFEDMIAPINIHSTSFQNDFKAIVNATFETDIRWGRIVGFYVLASKLAIKAMDCHKIDIVSDIIHWTVEVLNSEKMSRWLKANGGWDGIVEFYKSGQELQLSAGWTRACSYGFNVFAGAAQLVHKYIQRT